MSKLVVAFALPLGLAYLARRLGRAALRPTDDPALVCRRCGEVQPISQALDPQVTCACWPPTDVEVP